MADDPFFFAWELPKATNVGLLSLSLQSEKGLTCAVSCGVACSLTGHFLETLLSSCKATLSGSFPSRALPSLNLLSRNKPPMLLIPCLYCDSRRKLLLSTTKAPHACWRRWFLAQHLVSRMSTLRPASLCRHNFIIKLVGLQESIDPSSALVRRKWQRDLAGLTPWDCIPCQPLAGFP